MPHDDRLPAHREVGEPLLDEAEHLVAPRRRLHRVGIRGVVVEQALLVARQLEEVVLLGDPLDRPAVDRALAVDQLVLGVIGLARHAVEALVGTELDVAVVVDDLEELLDRPHVAGLGGADEVGVGEVEERREGPELLAGPVDHLLGRDALAPRRPAAILVPCSSVPVRNMTSSPQSRRHRASVSAATECTRARCGARRSGSRSAS